MRFLFYDRIMNLERGKSVTGIKTFALSEEFHRGHFSKIALVPGVIFVEAMAQLLGWLIIYSHDFKLSAIMSLIEGVNIPTRLRPGFKADIHAEILSTSKRDSLGKARVLVDGQEIASMNRIIYSHFHKVNPEELKERFRYYSGLKI
jgi:3-hydroxyacyl-[acyl-carrier-protein] dehydratase